MKRGILRTIVAGCLLAVLCFLHTIEAEPRAPVIVAIGDSLTAGLGLPQDEAFPAQLEAALKARGQAVSVVNAGVSGDTASAALARLDWAIPADASAVIVELGGNDALQGIPTEGIKSSLAKIIEQLQAKGLPILLAGMEAPPNMGKWLCSWKRTSNTRWSRESRSGTRATLPSGNPNSNGIALRSASRASAHRPSCSCAASSRWRMLPRHPPGAVSTVRQRSVRT